MSELKYCQGPKCHTYTTKDRLKGNGENKTFQTRRRSRMYYGKGNFCSMRTFYYRNKITQEQRTLTEEQYDDSNYTLNER